MRKIAVFGGSGATGHLVIKFALEREMRIRTLVRNASSSNLPPSAHVIEAPILNDNYLDSTIKNSEAVIILFGPRPPYTDIFCDEATKKIILSMQRNKVERLICQTGAMVGDYPANRTLPFRLMVSIFNRRLPKQAMDREHQEKEVLKSGLRWTIIKPPRLTDDKEKGKWTAGAHVKVGLLSSISRYDLARFIIEDVLQNNRYEGEAVFVRNRRGERP